MPTHILYKIIGMPITTVSWARGLLQDKYTIVCNLTLMFCPTVCQIKHILLLMVFFIIFRLLRTPPKNSQLHPKRDEDTSIADLLPASSPIMRAEEELYRLRDILRNSPTTPRELPQPKLQKKKFYGSEVVTQSRRSEMSPERHSESAKLKKKSSSNSPPSKSCKSSKSETANTKSKSSRRVLKGSGKGQSGTQDFSSQTRFDNAEDQMSRSPGDGHPQPNGLARTNRKPPVGETSGVSGEEGRRKTKGMCSPIGTCMTGLYICEVFLSTYRLEVISLVWPGMFISDD